MERGLGRLGRAETFERRAASRVRASREDKVVVFEQFLSGLLAMSRPVGYRDCSPVDVESRGIREDELKPAGWVLIEALRDGLEELPVGELSWEDSARGGHAPVEMAVGGHEGDLEWHGDACL